MLRAIMTGCPVRAKNKNDKHEYITTLSQL
jgi:hypothetical protein